MLKAIKALDAAGQEPKPPLSHMFTDVYDQPTKLLREQEAEIRQMVKRYPQDYPSDVPVE